MFKKKSKRVISRKTHDLLANALLEQHKIANAIKISGVKAFDKAMDANFNTNHIGGYNHRLFDGSHTILGAWKSTKYIEVPLINRIEGTAKALVNDFVTDKGLPLITITPETYQSICDKLPMIPKSVVYDLFKINIYDIIPMFKTFRYAKMVIKNQGDKYDLNVGLIACTTSQIVGQSNVGTIVSITTSIIAVAKSILDKDYVAAALSIPIGIGQILPLFFLHPLLGIPLTLGISYFGKWLRRRLTYR